MDELHRLNYLEALGVQQWVPRVPLLNARASEFAEPLSKHALSDDAAPDNSAARHEPVVESTPVEAISVESTRLQNTSDQEESLATRINLEVYGRNKAYALLLEKEHSKALSQIEVGLLNNILKALDKLAKSCLDESNVQIQSSFREAFTWPMFESPAEPDPVKGQQAMCDALNAFVSASIKRHQHSMLIISGNQLEHLIDQHFLGENIKMLTAPALHEMANTPERKAEIWQILLRAFQD